MLLGEWNLKDALVIAREEAREEVKEEALKEGIGINKVETAKSMLEEGLDLELVARVTKLPQKEILALR